jgi:hypothetical protein
MPSGLATRPMTCRTSVFSAGKPVSGQGRKFCIYPSLGGPQTQIKIYKKNSLVICFSSIYMDQQLVYVRGCKRYSLHPVCKEFFSQVKAGFPKCLQIEWNHFPMLDSRYLVYGN